MFYNFFKMKKKFLKGEVATIITLGTLIVLGVSSLVSTVFLKKRQTIKTKAAGCSQVSTVSYSGNVAAGKTFTCLASTDGASPYTMACGISKNGSWPYGMRSGSCSRTRCTFSVKMDDQIEAGAVYELVAFDFRSDCGPDTGYKIKLNVLGTQPQPTQANCDQECCGRPDGFIYQRAIKERCDSNYKGGRYVIIDGVCQGGKKTEKPGCATCKTCQAGAPDISPVPGADLAVNECTSSCEQSGGGICSNLPNCPANITPAIVRSCSDTSFSCTQGYTACKKDGAIWCYGSARSGEGGNPTPNLIDISPSTNPSPTGITPRGGEGQLCKIGYEHGEKYYYCDGNLVCSKQSSDGICVTSNPTNIPSSTNPPLRGENPPPTGITPRGGEGQLCKIGYEHGEKYYYCDGNLVCKEQSPNGICVTPTPTPTPTPTLTHTPTPTATPTNTAILTPTSQPICDPYDPNLPNCVTPTPTPTINLNAVDYNKRGTVNITLHVLNINMLSQGDYFVANLTSYGNKYGVIDSSTVSFNYPNVARFSKGFFSPNYNQYSYILSVYYFNKSLNRQFLINQQTIKFRADEFTKNITLNYDLSQGTPKDYKINFQFKNNNCDVKLVINKNSLYIDRMKFSFPSNDIILYYNEQKNDTFTFKENLLTIKNHSKAKIDTFCFKSTGTEFLTLTNIPLTLTGDREYTVIIER
jgi:hypothetical protein